MSTPPDPLPNGPRSTDDAATDPHDQPSSEQLAAALAQIHPTRRRGPRLRAGHVIRIAIYSALLLAASAALYAARFDANAITAQYAPIAQRIARGGMFVAVVLLAGALADGYVVERFSDEATRYNVRRLLHFMQGGAVAFVVLSVLFVNWYTAAVSLGIASAIVGFALQTPLSSLVGWMYILAKRPYAVGDRIQIGNATGDVIDVGYLDTTLWEFGGPYVSSDHPSGRLIRVPNAQVLWQSVYNYSWPLFPYIWSEIYVQIAYGSDLGFVSSTMQRIVENELGPRMVERVGKYRELLAKTAIDELQVQAHPVVLFRVSHNTWVEAVVRYLVSPRRAADIRSRLTVQILDELKAEPGRVAFPEGAAR